MASLEGEAPIKQCVTILEKKVRNLEKRKVKLDSYKNKAKEGVVLDKDQQEAVSKYDHVVQNLEFSKELLKQFQQINNESEKLLRKQAKREKIEKQNSDISRLKELMKCQAALKTITDSDAREAFKSGKCCVMALSEDQLKVLDDFQNILSLSKEAEHGYSEQCGSAAEHWYLLLEKSEKVVLGEVTYKEVGQLIDSITGGSYFDTRPPLEKCQEKEVLADSPIERVSEESKNSLNGIESSPENASASPNGFETTGTDVLPESSPVLHPELSEATILENGASYQNSESMHSQQPMSELQAVSVGSPVPPPGVMIGGPWQNSEPHVQPQLLTRTTFIPPMSAQYFGTSTFEGQRPLRDIVSSMQGSYNFLQESLIESAENQNNVNNSSIVDVSADAAVSSPSASLHQQMIDNHHHLHTQQDQHLPMATIAGSQAGGYATVYQNRLHQNSLLHHEGQVMGMPTTMSSDVYFSQQQQQQLYQRVPNVYDRSNQTIPDVMDQKQLQQIPSNISTTSSMAYSPYHSMPMPQSSEADCQIPGFLIGSVPGVSVYQQQPQQPQQQLESQKGSYTMNPNADIFQSGFHSTSQADVGMAGNVQVEQPQNGSPGQAEEPKDVGTKTFAQTAQGMGKSYQEFTNTQNQRGPKPQFQRYPNRHQFVNRQGNGPPYNNNSNPRAGIPYRGGAKFGGQGGARPPSQGTFYQRNEHY